MILIINIQYQSELVGLVSLGDKQADQFFRVDLTIFCHFNHAKYILNFLVGELLTKGLEHGFELVWVNSSWGSTLKGLESCNNCIVIILFTRRLGCKHVQENSEADGC